MSTFDKAVQKAREWQKEIAEVLNTEDDQQAYTALRAALQALRDRLTVDEAAQLAAQLPVLIRGIFYEGWDPSKVPVKARHRDEFLRLVKERMGRVDTVDPEAAVRAVFGVLRKHVSGGEIEDVLASLPGEVRDLLAA